MARTLATLACLHAVNRAAPQRPVDAQDRPNDHTETVHEVMLWVMEQAAPMSDPSLAAARTADAGLSLGSSPTAVALVVVGDAVPVGPDATVRP